MPDKIKLTVDRIESHSQSIEVEVDADLSWDDQIIQAQEIGRASCRERV